MMNAESHPKNSFGLAAFDHVTLIVADVQASREFYVDRLGMSEAERPSFSFPGAWFQLGDTFFHITEASGLAGKAGWGDRGVTQISRGHHIAFRTVNFDLALEAINRFEIEIAAGPQTRPDGAKQVYLYDPDRHLIEICS
jgi:catechol 2,3-dioxygenase-like lactoylglutathione lyase family enzyme